MPASRSRHTIGIVSSCGAPLAVVRSLRSAFEQHEHAYILTEPVIPSDDMVGRTHVVRRSPMCGGSLLQCVRVWRLFRSRRPGLIVGPVDSGTAPLLVAAALRRIPIVLIETGSAADPPRWSAGLLRLLANRWIQGRGMRASSASCAHDSPQSDDAAAALQQALMTARLERVIQELCGGGLA